MLLVSVVIISMVHLLVLKSESLFSLCIWSYLSKLSLMSSSLCFGSSPLPVPLIGFFNFFQFRILEKEYLFAWFGSYDL